MEVPPPPAQTPANRAFYPERVNFWKHCAVNGARRAAVRETITEARERAPELRLF